jgi:CxxC motif-containing protein (DUF1111 family)
MRRRTRLILSTIAAAALTGAAALAFGVEAVAPISPSLGGQTTRAIEGKTAFTFPAANIEQKHQRDFFFGNRLFNTNWVVAPASVKSFDGLGPLFNRVSCSGCHTQDGRGRPPLSPDEPMTSMLIRLSIPDANSPNGAAPHPVYGDQLSDNANKDVPPEGNAKVSYQTVEGTYGDGAAYELLNPSYRIENPGYGPLPQDLMISPRVANQVIGLGLLEAVPEETLLALADPDDKNADGISGKVNRVPHPGSGEVMIGRFGWKANSPDLPAQNASASIGDIGLTNPFFKTEHCTPAQEKCLSAYAAPELDTSDKFFAKLNLYTRLIAVPAQRKPNDPVVKKGEALFNQFGCGACHVTTLQTGPEAVLPELANQTFHPFTDLLLHDMGEALADNRPDFEATGTEWRTPPLWGLGLIEIVNGHNRLLHDGRARGFAEAILWHGGEGEAAKEAFRNAAKEERDALVRFLGSL